MLAHAAPDLLEELGTITNVVITNIGPDSCNEAIMTISTALLLRTIDRSYVSDEWSYLVFVYY